MRWGMLLMVLVAFASCNKEALNPIQGWEPITLSNGNTSSFCGNTTIKSILNGSENGNVTIGNDGTHLHFHFEAAAGKSFTDYHIYVGALGDLPVNNGNGNPIPGHFPYKDENLASLTSFTVSIPIINIDADLGGCFMISAKTNLGWVNGEAINDGRYFEYCLQECISTCDEVDNTKFTIYGKGSYNGSMNSGPNKALNNYFNNGGTAITIGCGANTITFNTASEVRAYLNTNGATGTPNDINTPSVLSGHTLALALNIAFDLNPDLKDLTIKSGVLTGKTVAEALSISNEIIGICHSEYNFSQINQVIDQILSSFHGSGINAFLEDCN